LQQKEQAEAMTSSMPSPKIVAAMPVASSNCDGDGDEVAIERSRKRRHNEDDLKVKPLAKTPW